ncbi:hypothetical protein QE152_g1150 [Popillia japonica]|uniref:Uncharacterized protein n=1 Tax=Popillia japonica TaxID=7064 RepID=A0AAW1N3H5_POPJA
MFLHFLLFILLSIATSEGQEIQYDGDSQTGAEDSSSKKFRDFLQEWPTPGTGPYFDTNINSNITGLVGKTVLLHCRVKNLGNRTCGHRRIPRIPKTSGSTLTSLAERNSYVTLLEVKHVE